MFSRHPLYGIMPHNILGEAFGPPSPVSRAAPAAKTAPRSDSVPVVRLTQATHQKVMEALNHRPFDRERGGLLFGPKDTPDLAIGFVEDEWGDSRPASFTIDAKQLNSAIQRVQPAQLTCVGIVHSHPDGVCQPSAGDVEFLQRIFSNPKNVGGTFQFPIVCGGKLHAYVVDTTNVTRIQTAELVLV